MVDTVQGNSTLIVPRHIKVNNNLNPRIQGANPGNMFSFYNKKKFKNQIHPFPKNWLRYFLDDLTTNGSMSI